MTARLDYRKFSKEPLKAMLDLEAYLAQCGLDLKLLHMIKLRASQNKRLCVLHRYALERRARRRRNRACGSMDSMLGASRLITTDRERARAGVDGIPHSDFEYARAGRGVRRIESAFSEKEIVDLTYAISAPLISGTGLRFASSGAGSLPTAAEIFGSQLKIRKFLFVMRGFLRAGQLRTETDGGQGEVAECLNKKPSSKHIRSGESRGSKIPCRRRCVSGPRPRMRPVFPGS